jgi:hypothetical protein
VAYFEVTFALYLEGFNKIANKLGIYENISKSFCTESITN